MKKLAIMALLLATTACNQADLSEDKMNEKFAEANKAARDMAGKAQGAFSDFLKNMKPDKEATAASLAETGETTIGETDAPAAAAGAEAPAAGEAAAPAEAGTQAVAEAPMSEVEQKVAEVRQAVTELIPVGKYTMTGVTNGGNNLPFELRADGSYVESSGSGFMRKVGEEACFENEYGVLCYAVADKGDGKRELSGRNVFLFTPVP
jgi:hypothetical protein